MANRGRRSPIDNVRWTTANASGLGISAGTTAVNIFTAQNNRETVLRTRGHFAAWIDAAGGPGTSVIVTAGMALVPEGSGTTAAWEPFSDGDAPWFWYTEFVLAYEERVTDVVDVPGMTSFREVVDSKAMRKIPSDTEIQFVLTNTSLNGALAIDFSFNGRILLGER